MPLAKRGIKRTGYPTRYAILERSVCRPSECPCPPITKSSSPQDPALSLRYVFVFQLDGVDLAVAGIRKVVGSAVESAGSCIVRKRFAHALLEAVMVGAPDVRI
ncbi:hypothetical protein GMDG_05347 [Pseudogymnoascus destructans 20631-21]|uniref:Uncharacterized protein n=1 Tax=Pseudogymnoascus destructans (strain ATCC MYA-4855 / 20631-21) TaxID=658429 RepID=L8FMY5_PSED2|nr:hypothetical protein GMDG_05347 [Pseudogymnoascus destructans 20631-21]